MCKPSIPHCFKLILLFFFKLTILNPPCSRNKNKTKLKDKLVLETNKKTMRKMKP